MAAAVTLHVIWRWWKISLRSDSRNTKPGAVRESHSDYLDDSRLQRIERSRRRVQSIQSKILKKAGQVAVVFGSGVLQHSKNLCQGRSDYLQSLPDSLLLNIMSHLELEDVARFACTCHRFKELCSSGAFWEDTVRMNFDTVTPDMEDLAEEVGWRTVFFTNKLQLQKQIRRRKLKSKMPHKDSWAKAWPIPTVPGLGANF